MPRILSSAMLPLIPSNTTRLSSHDTMEPKQASPSESLAITPSVKSMECFSSDLALPVPSALVR